MRKCVWGEIAGGFGVLLVIVLFGAACFRPDLAGQVIRSFNIAAGIYVDHDGEAAEAWNSMSNVLHRRCHERHQEASALAWTTFIRDPRENKEIFAAAGFSDPDSLAGADLEDWKLVDTAVKTLVRVQKEKEEELRPMLEQFQKQHARDAQEQR